MLLLERDRQLAQLTRWHEAIEARGGCVVLVTGEAGIGKTATVSEFIRRRAAAVRALWGACDPLFTPQPLGPLRDVSRQVGGPLLDAMTEGTNRERIFAAMLDELQRAGNPVVLVMEDMHWADDATLDLMKYVGRRIGRTRAMLIATYRTDEIHARHPLQTSVGLLPSDSVRRLPLEALSEEAINELAQTLGRSPAGLYAATAGNPFYVTELLAAPPGEIPTSVRDAVVARVARLSREAHAVAELVAAVPGQTETWLIQAVLRAREAAIDECTLGGMKRNADESLAFRHELARRAIEDELAPTHARALHTEILQALKARERGEVGESRLVHHAVRAGDVAAVLEFAPLAAERSADVGAHRAAVAYYRTALRYKEQMLPTARASVLDRLAYECSLTGEIDAAIHARSEALAIWRSSGNLMRTGETLCSLSRLHWFRGLGEETRRCLTEAVSALETLAPSHELAMAISTLSQIEMLSSQDERAVKWGERAIDLARRLGSDAILAHALNNIGAARLRKVGDAGWLDLQRSLELSLQCRSEENISRAYGNLGSFAIGIRDYRAAGPPLAAALAFCIEHELSVFEAYVRAYRARMNFEQGAWADAIAEAEELLRQPGLSVAARIPALTVVGQVRLRRGAKGAHEPLEEACRLAHPTGEPQRIVTVAAARVEHAWLLGDREGAGREMRRALEFALRDHNHWRTGEFAFWCWRAGTPVSSAIAVASPFRLHMSGDCLGAARAWASVGCPYEEACALADSPDPDLRKRALEIFAALGAQPMAQKVRKQLKAEGVKGLKRGANRSTRANAAGLTLRQLEVLALMAQNLSNAEIARRLYVSIKTVDHHASAILNKLCIESRHDAAAAAHKLGIDLMIRKRPPEGSQEVTNVERSSDRRPDRSVGST